MGCVHSVIKYADLKKKSAQNLINYIKKHSERIVNYEYFSQESLCSIGSGAVESAVKQIGKRLKISGAQWKMENVSRMLQLRSAYLNGSLLANIFAKVRCSPSLLP
ncbi:hypothetical protein NIES4101_74240 [Calothrix sp. NIES-4101]|nr:hypothetical protein NIES4101_74240 [Calothrix sp. NIES-4101]